MSKIHGKTIENSYRENFGLEQIREIKSSRNIKSAIREIKSSQKFILAKINPNKVVSKYGVILMIQ